ncbi:MAG: tetratricopeptide repeat protein [Planctomycetaceae bacterium]
MQKQNWDYAIQMFGTCVSIKPDHKIYRETLRGCIKKKYDDNKTGAGGLAKAKLMGIRSRIKKARSAENWEDLDKAAEEGLLINPWDPQLNLDVGEAAWKREFMEVAESAYMAAFQSDLKHKENASKYADILEERGKYTDAIKVLEHVQKLDPKDLEVGRRITRLSAKQTTVKGGFEDAESTADVRKGAAAQASARPGESVAPGQSEESDLLHSVRRNPNSFEHVHKLAVFYKKEKRLEDALEQLNKALQMSGNDVGIREQVEDVELDILRRNRDTARELANGGDETAKKNFEELEKELVKRELQVYLAREQRYPQDMKLKMEIAHRFMRFGKWPEAIPRLQKAANDTRLKGQGLALLGQCFYRDGKLPLARGQLERAIPELDVERDPKLYKDTFYTLARICEELGDSAKAEEYYGEILVVDYEFRDARQRLEKLQEGG